MAIELTNVAVQTVAATANVAFAETPVRDCRGLITHREGSGIITLRGAPNGARYKVTFGANVAIPTGGAVAPIMLALAIDGEALGGSTMISTPMATAALNNVSASVFVVVPCSCCATFSVRNTGAAEIEVGNANLIIERVA